jgi:D-aspartate ligase
MRSVIPKDPEDHPIAVVVGLCAHGLCLARSLTCSGVRVVALEANPLLPGVRTSCAQVIMVDDINGVGLVGALIGLAPKISEAGTPVLFLTNDTMVETVGQHRKVLESLYRVSWLRQSAVLLPLLRKQGVASRCEQAGMAHPRSQLITCVNDALPANLSLRFPVIFKPDRPISAYKTLIVGSADELNSCLGTIESALPAIAQEYIPGGDSSIRFAALYLKEGRVVSRFEGRKLRSRPMGHTTVAVAEVNDELHEMAVMFFDRLGLSGPVSLEVKQDQAGGHWIIEPTVGRTDFWVGLCIADGVDLPYIEYSDVVDSEVAASQQKGRTVWINEERDPAAMIWLLMNHPQLFARRITALFPYRNDNRPLMAWMAQKLRALPSRTKSKLNRTLRLGASQ